MAIRFADKFIAEINGLVASINRSSQPETTVTGHAKRVVYILKRTDIASPEELHRIFFILCTIPWIENDREFLTLPKWAWDFFYNNYYTEHLKSYIDDDVQKMLTTVCVHLLAIDWSEGKDRYNVFINYFRAAIRNIHIDRLRKYYRNRAREYPWDYADDRI